MFVACFTTCAATRNATKSEKNESDWLIHSSAQKCVQSLPRKLWWTKLPVMKSNISILEKLIYWTTKSCKLHSYAPVNSATLHDNSTKSLLHSKGDDNNIKKSVCFVLCRTSMSSIAYQAKSGLDLFLMSYITMFNSYLDSQQQVSLQCSYSSFLTAFRDGFQTEYHFRQSWVKKTPL